MPGSQEAMAGFPLSVNVMLGILSGGAPRGGSVARISDREGGIQISRVKKNVELSCPFLKADFRTPGCRNNN